jgi:hypothetical protein
VGLPAFLKLLFFVVELFLLSNFFFLIELLRYGPVVLSCLRAAEGGGT